MTPERIEQERKAFEEWYASTYLPTPMHGRTNAERWRRLRQHCPERRPYLPSNP